ncbi:YggS family pyridoxal phosphate-dependent enzyme [Myroides sp. LJL116]
MNVVENLNKIKSELPQNVTLVAVSKTKPNELILEAYQGGQRIFGENKIQEMTQKYEDLPKDIQWHMIGHVQRNKVKYMASFVSLIHGVDSFRLLKEINKQAKANNRVIPCLLQMFIASEDTKFGLDKAELFEILDSQEFKEMENIQIKGLMGMASFTQDTAQVRKEFENLHTIFEQTKEQYTNQHNISLDTLSMGMSNDFALAIECGSNMVRIGSSIFGNRNY